MTDQLNIHINHIVNMSTFSWSTDLTNTVDVLIWCVCVPDEHGSSGLVPDSRTGQMWPDVYCLLLSLELIAHGKHCLCFV